MADLPRSGAETLRGGLDWLGAQSAARRWAMGASGVWAVLVLAYGLGFFAASQARGTVFLDAAFFLVTLALPVILIWIAAALAEELARQRAMIAGLADRVGPLTTALQAARSAGPAERGGETGAAFERLIEGQARLEAALEAVRRSLEALATPPARHLAPEAERQPPALPHGQPTPVPQPRPAAKPRARRQPSPAAPAAQPDLPTLAEPQPEARLDWDDLMRAFDFPRDADDREGFRALRLALRHHRLAQMLQAAEDVLTLLSQEGVYMDDVAPGAADPDAWRRFVAGERGASVAGMGAVEDETALRVARALMKSDPIFRDTALFFQRRFDAVLGELAAGAEDGELAQLADTRSGRAFQLMARASGSFD